MMVEATPIDQIAGTAQDMTKMLLCVAATDMIQTRQRSPRKLGAFHNGQSHAVATNSKVTAYCPVLQHHAEASLAAHHALVSFRDLFERIDLVQAIARRPAR